MLASWNSLFEIRHRAQPALGSLRRPATKRASELEAEPAAHLDVRQSDRASRASAMRSCSETRPCWCCQPPTTVIAEQARRGTQVVPRW